MSESDSIDISDMPQILKAIEEAADNGRRLDLRDGTKIIGTVLPAEHTPQKPYHGRLSEEQVEAILSVAGAWKGFDSETFLEEVYATREMDDRPPVKL